MKKLSLARFRPFVVELENRAVPAVNDPVGTFAVIDGKLAATVQTSSHRLTFDSRLFRFTKQKTVSVKIQGSSSDLSELLLGAAVNVKPNPLPGSKPSSTQKIVQFPAGKNAQIFNFKSGDYTLPVSGGLTNRQGSYHLSFQLVGDINGDNKVNQSDVRLMTNIKNNPLKYSPQVLSSADYDGSGKVDSKDLRLTTLNLLASSVLKPLGFETQINTLVTPIVRGYTRDANASILVGGSPLASYVATNLTVSTIPEVSGSLSATGNGLATLPLQLGQNQLAVSLHDRFGQSLSTFLNIIRLPTAVMVIPDLGGSVPYLNTSEGNFAFYNKRGTPAASLTVSSEYVPMINSLIASGYSLNRDLFIAPYDWRLTQAPVDANADGNLSDLTSSVITQANSPYQVGYIGSLMASMVTNDATIKSVDIVSVGGGSILARAYIQSPALGGAFQNSTGATFSLPKVEKLIMASAPSEGIPQFYNQWTNDFNGAFGSNTASVMGNLNTLYNKVVAGTFTIPGPDYTIDKAAITDPNTGQPSPLLFAQLYFPSFRQNIADYNFLFVNWQMTNLNTLAGSSPQLMIDLNYGNKPGNNPWLSRVASAAASAGVTTTTITQLNQQTGQGGSLWPVGQPFATPAVDGQTWYQTVQTNNEGDGIVPLVSLLSTFANDPRITLKLWGSPNVTLPSGITFTPTNGSSTHLGLLTNNEFIAWLKQKLQS